MSIGTIGSYTLLEVLGTGDMGTTYRAQAPDQTEAVALKVLDKVDTSNEMKRGSAVELIEFAATLQHPRLCPITAVIDSADGRLGIVMPLSPVGSMGDLMAGGKTIPPQHGLKMLGQLASGVQFLHDQEVAHGSIKPNNILLDHEGNATLTDLSMAHLRELGLVPASPTRQHLLFMPPEREYHAAPEVVGDVFSFAVLTYLLLTGKMPFDDPDPEARGTVPPLNLPPMVAAVLRREMNPHLRLRYTSLLDFMNALKAALKGEIDPETEKVFGITAPRPSA